MCFLDPYFLKYEINQVLLYHHCGQPSWSHFNTLCSSFVDQLKQILKFVSELSISDPAFRSCYSNITLLKFYD